MSIGARTADYLRAVSRAATWQKIVTVQVLALPLALLRWSELRPMAADEHSRFADPRLLVLTIISMSAAALLILIATLLADEAVRRGAPAKTTYLAGLVIACVANAILFSFLREWYEPEPSTGPLWPRIAFWTIDVGVFGAFFIWVWVDRRTRNQMMEFVREADARRARLERRLIDSQIASAQARIDPHMLFDALKDIRQSLQMDHPDADVKLEALIARLRGSLSRATEIERAAVKL
jgi:hypothetical protein